MISLLLLLLLAWNFYIGYSRGLILQGYYFLASIISLFMAGNFYQGLAKHLTLWIPYVSPTEGASVHFFKSVNLFKLDQVFYAGIAFTAIYLLFYLIFRFFGIFAHFTDLDHFDSLLYNCLAGAMTVLVTLTGLSLIFNLLATLPADFVQDTLSSSWLVRGLINLPIISSVVKSLWVTAILK